MTRTISSKVCSPRWATPRSPDRRTLGGAAADVAIQLGTPFMPWQRQVADVALEIDPATGRFIYREVGLTVPRQSGKTTLILAVAIVRAFAQNRQQIRYTAQTGKDARAKLIDDWLPALDGTPFMKRKLVRPRMTNGHEGLLFQGGSRLGLVATTKESGHGGTIDLAFLDEAFALKDSRLEQALRPAMSTRNRDGLPGTQLWVVSTAGTPADSPYLWEKVEKYREIAAALLTHSVCYFEWSAQDDQDPAAEETWWGCMPALGHTQTVETIRAEFLGMSLNDFERAFLNRWKNASIDPVIPLATWKNLRDPNSQAEDPVCLAFDVTPDSQSASIAAAGWRPDKLAHVEVIDQRHGTDWLAPRLAELVQKHHPIAVVCDPAGTAGSVLPTLAALDVEVITLTAREHAQGFGQFVQMVTEGQVKHLGTPELIAALDGAVKRELGDAHAWSRKNSSIDISPLVAVTLALWGLRTREEGLPTIWNLDELAREAREAIAAQTPQPQATEQPGVTFTPFALR